MGESYLTCYSDEELTPENHLQKGRWVWDPYSVILMYLVSQELLADLADPWKRKVGAEFLAESKSGGSGCKAPDLSQFAQSLQQLQIIRDAYSKADVILRQYGAILPRGFEITYQLSPEVVSGGQDIPITHLREEAQATVKLIDDFIRDRYGADEL